MLTITNAEASANILRFVEEERLTQAKWHGQSADGREIACLLGAIHPSVTSVAECNGALMPMWLAELTPTLFDAIAPEHVYPIARRYGELVGRWHTLSPAQWDAVLIHVLIRCIDDAVTAARSVSEGRPYWSAIEAACAQSRAAVLGGDRSTIRTAEATARAAEAAAKAAARAARAAGWAAEATARAAEAAARAAEAAAEAARAGLWAAGAAARAAEAAAWAAGWAAEAGGRAAARAAWATRAAAYLFLFTFIFDQIECALST